MIHTYKINFNQIRQNASLSIMLDALERGFAAFGIDFYLVGAVSRDVWMSGIHKLTPRRTTGDIDFTYKDGTQVDLLPFGAIEDEERKVTVRGTGFTSVNVDGFKEVYDHVLPAMELEKHHFKFCTLPGIVLLKLIAWDDRPEARRDDILDISDILHHYFDMNSDEIWEKHFDLFADEAAELIEIAATVMGRQLKEIVAASPALQTRITDILIDNTEDPTKSKIALIMVEYFKNTIEDNVELLSLVLSGFK